MSLLLDLPIDLLLLIISAIDSRSTLRELSFACKILRMFAQQELFSVFSDKLFPTNGEALGIQNPRAPDSLLLFTRTIILRPDLAFRIKSIEIITHEKNNPVDERAAARSKSIIKSLISCVADMDPSTVTERISST